MQNHCITKLIGIGELKINSVEVFDHKIIVYCQLKNKHMKKCRHCGHLKPHKHDHRVQDIRDIPILGKQLILRFTRYRYKCPCCGKKQEVRPHFVSHRKQWTGRLEKLVYEEFTALRSATEIAKELYISVTSLFRIIDQIEPQRRELPEVLCIDEFKGDSGKEKYQASLGDGKNHQLIDVLPTRKEKDLIKYFSTIPQEERQNVRVFVSDMSKVFKRIQEAFFPNSLYVTDKYHFIRQIFWAFERIRKREQKTMSTHDRLYFKRSRSLLTKPMEKLTPQEIEKVILMLEKNEAIRKAYYLKEAFYRYVLAQKTREGAEKALDYWIEEAKASGEDEWGDAIKCFSNWRESILNSFAVPYTNGYLEGLHNRIKTIKRVSFHMPNFNHFRTKICLVMG